MPPTRLTLKILLPVGVFLVREDVTRIVARTPQGMFGFLPRRLDGVAVLSTGILTYESEDRVERYVAVDEGVLVKTGANITISVRNAIDGDDLHTLRTDVERLFQHRSEQERNIHLALAKLESSFMRQFIRLHHG